MPVIAPASANGVVTHLNRVTNMSGGGSISGSTTHEDRFRVEGKPFALRGTYTLSDGDQVAEVGFNDGNVNRVFALRNFTTGTNVSFATVKKSYVYACFGLGVLLLPLFGIGLIFIALGVFGLRRLSRQNNLLELFEQVSGRGKGAA